MKFARGLCRLLGFGGDGPGQDVDGAPGATDGRKDQGSSQVQPDQDGLDDDGRVKRKAERRKAKRKRQKERKKRGREEKLEEDKATGAMLQSDSKEELTGEARWSAAHPGNTSSCQPSSEEEPEWDVSCAFVANAASHIKLKGVNRSAVKYENQAGKTQQVMRRGRSLTVQGIQMFKQGQYTQAVDKFTEAICCDPNDHRIYGNRAYCYLCLEQYSCALADARTSIQLSPDWPKGHFRKGCALMGLKRYGEAEQAMQQVLHLDQHCKEASGIMLRCRRLQLMDMGFKEEKSEELLEKFTTVQAAIASPEAKALQSTSLQDQSGSCRTLWVGNITFDVTEKELLDFFKMFGEIDHIKVLHGRCCAFINFKNASVAAAVLEKQNVELGSRKLVMRYPDSWIQRTLPSTQRTDGLSSSAAGMQQPSAAPGSKWRPAQSGDECIYWRTTGCLYGNRCSFKHLPDQQGQDNNR